MSASARFVFSAPRRELDFTRLHESQELSLSLSLSLSPLCADEWVRGCTCLGEVREVFREVLKQKQFARRYIEANDSCVSMCARAQNESRA